MTPLDPTTLSPRQLEELGPHAVHQLALRATNTLTRYRLLLGRCLLALHRSQDYLQFGCSSAVHYATAQLGMRPDSARQLRRLAFQLESLPQLTQHAQQGTISWAKLREVARIATPDTEAFWIEACQNHSYQEIERLVAHARDPQNRSHPLHANLRCVHFLDRQGVHGSLSDEVDYVQGCELEVSSPPGRARKNFNTQTPF